MKRSEKQIAASRLNGAKSRGPVSAQGRLNSANSNNWRQTMLARTVVLDIESRDRFNELHQSLIEELQPATAIENLLVQKMVVAQWRQMRAWSFETAGIQGNREVDLERTNLSENRCDRQFQRALASLALLRGKKHLSNPQPQENNAAPTAL